MTLAISNEPVDAAVGERAAPLPDAEPLTDAARTIDSEPLSDSERAAAEAVGLAKSVAVGSLIGVVVSFFVVLLAMGLAGYGWGPGAGLAAFTAFWGGLGFGSMVGGVTYLSSLEDH